MHALICDAIRARRLLRFVYEGYERIIEPHSREMHDVHVLAEPFPGPRPGVNPQTPTMRQIFCQLELRDRPQPRGHPPDPEMRP